MKNHKQIQEKFNHDGFYIAKHIIKENQIKKILDTFCKVYFKNNPSSNFIKKKKIWDEDLFHQEIIKFRNEKPNKFSEVYDTVQPCVSVFHILTGERISQIVATLLRCKPIELSVYGSMVRMDTPHDARNKTTLHQEMHVVYNPGLVLWMPLLAPIKDIGGLRILEKSHSDGEIIVKKNKDHDYITSRASKSFIPKKILNKYNEKAISINKGDALFFDNKLIHGSGKNTSKRIRFTCQIRFFNTVSNEFTPFRPIIKHNPHTLKKLGRKI